LHIKAYSQLQELDQEYILQRKREAVSLKEYSAFKYATEEKNSCWQASYAKQHNAGKCKIASWFYLSSFPENTTERVNRQGSKRSTLSINQLLVSLS
jgi:hypothetical protein